MAMTETQLKAYTLLIVPGGNSITISDNLSRDAVINIQNAVASGLHYLGICAGSFFGGYSIYNGVDLTSGVWFNFYADEYRGIHKEPVEISFSAGGPLDIYWQDGPQLSGWGNIIGKYPDGTPAIVEGQYGSGWVILSGVHPEAPANWRTGMNFTTPLTVDLAYANTPDLLKGNVKKNISPRPEVEKLFLTSSPCPLCEALGSAFFLCGPCGRALFHLSSFIFVSSDDADRFLRLASAMVVRCQPWIYLRLVA